MSDLVTASFISGGSNILSGFLSKPSSQSTDWSQAKEGIQWRVADAKKAGIHPLAALGMPTVSGTTFNAADNNLSNAVGAAGESAIRYHMLKNENQKILNDTAETAARVRLMDTQADIAMDQYENSKKALAGHASSSSQDQVEVTVPAQRTTGITPRSDIQSISDVHGEIVGESYGVHRS